MADIEVFLDQTPGETRGVVARKGRYHHLILQRDSDRPSDRLGARCVGRVARVEPERQAGGGGQDRGRGHRRTARAQGAGAASPRRGLGRTAPAGRWPGRGRDSFYSGARRRASDRCGRDSRRPGGRGGRPVCLSCRSFLRPGSDDPAHPRPDRRRYRPCARAGSRFPQESGGGEPRRIVAYGPATDAERVGRTGRDRPDRRRSARRHYNEGRARRLCGRAAGRVRPAEPLWSDAVVPAVAEGAAGRTTAGRRRAPNTRDTRHRCRASVAPRPVVRSRNPALRRPLCARRGGAGCAPGRGPRPEGRSAGRSVDGRRRRQN
uniref:LigA n=1 Tax=Parastrongyloides trichosuri TaxID=131310 RepID=A0A0N4Z8I9_PARTI